MFTISPDRLAAMAVYPEIVGGIVLATMIPENAGLEAIEEPGFEPVADWAPHAPGSLALHHLPNMPARGYARGGIVLTILDDDGALVIVAEGADGRWALVTGGAFDGWDDLARMHLVEGEGATAPADPSAEGSDRVAPAAPVHVPPAPVALDLPVLADVQRTSVGPAHPRLATAVQTLILCEPEMVALLAVVDVVEGGDGEPDLQVEAHRIIVGPELLAGDFSRLCGLLAEGLIHVALEHPHDVEQDGSAALQAASRLRAEAIMETMPGMPIGMFSTDAAVDELQRALRTAGIDIALERNALAKAIQTSKDDGVKKALSKVDNVLIGDPTTTHDVSGALALGEAVNKGRSNRLVDTLAETAPRHGDLAFPARARDFIADTFARIAACRTIEDGLAAMDVIETHAPRSFHEHYVQPAALEVLLRRLKAAGLKSMDVSVAFKERSMRNATPLAEGPLITL